MSASLKSSACEAIALTPAASIASAGQKASYAITKKMGAQTAEANSNAGIAAANQINAYFADGCTKFQVNK